MNIIYHYALNSRDVYCKVEVLINQVAKRIRKNLPVLEDYLAKCSSMTKITHDCIKLREQLDFESTKKFERDEARQMLARYIIDGARFLAS